MFRFISAYRGESDFRRIADSRRYRLHADGTLTVDLQNPTAQESAAFFAWLDHQHAADTAWLAARGLPNPGKGV